jgi:AcrR family transcriptional regulator
MPHAAGVDRTRGSKVPKIVDHEERRREVIEALWRVIAKHGIEHVSTRSVAAEAGWSRGIVDYYFDNMDELLLAGLSVALEVDLDARREAAEHPGAEALRTMLLQSMPLDDERRLRGKVWLSYLGRAVSDPAICKEFARCQEERGQVWAAVVEGMIAATEMPSLPDAQAQAAHIMSFELAVNVYEMLNPGRVTPDVTVQHVDQFVDRLMAGTAAAV